MSLPPLPPPPGVPPYNNPPRNLPPVPPPGQLYMTPQVPLGAPLPPPPRSEQELAWKLFGGWGTLFVSMAMILVGLVLAYVVLIHLAQERRYETEGVETPAKFVRKFTKEHTGRRGRKSTDYYITYRFVDKAGTAREADDEVDFLGWTNAHVSSRLVVQYMPDDPATNRLLADRSQLGNWIMTLISAVLLIAGSCLWLFGKKSAARRAAVVFRGRPVPGHVLVSEINGSGKNLRAVLQYRWRDQMGRDQTSKRFNVKPGVLGHFPVGSSITVLVDPNDPKRPEPDLWGIRG